MNISMTPELERFVAEQIAAGHYNSASEVVREALRLLEERDQVRNAQIAAFNPELDDRLASLDRGEQVDPETIQSPLPNSHTEVERWLGEEVAPVYDRMQASPERAIPAEQVFGAVRRRHTEQRKRSS